MPEAKGFTDAEREAMKARAEELKAERGGKKKADNAKACLDAIDKMPEPEKTFAERIHAVVTANAPDLAPKTWYGMPAYANAKGKVVCYFQAASKFESRYSTFGFDEAADLDEGTMWPTSWAITDLTEDDVAMIERLVKKAVS